MPQFRYRLVPSRLGLASSRWRFRISFQTRRAKTLVEASLRNKKQRNCFCGRRTPAHERASFFSSRGTRRNGGTESLRGDMSRRAPRPSASRARPTSVTAGPGGGFRFFICKKLWKTRARLYRNRFFRKIIDLQHFPRSTSFAHVCTAPGIFLL